MRKKSLFKIFLILLIACVAASHNFSEAAVFTGNANNPLLVEGMVPVKWDGLNWIVTDELDIEWYDYANAKPANIMLEDGLVVSGGRVTTPGSMFVWIPRFTYKVIGSTVDIAWTAGIADDTNGYLRSPAFFYGEYLGGENVNDNANFALRNGITNELPGIWVAKFMASGSADSIKVIPNSSFYTGAFETLFRAAKDMNQNTDYGITNDKVIMHMMKNSEWAAAAYLSACEETIPYINNNSNKKTGYGGSTQNASASSSSTYIWDGTTGKNASTTHNIYGIYDMSGGQWEYVASYIGGSSAPTISSDSVNDVDKIKLSKSDSAYNNEKTISDMYDGLALSETRGFDGDAGYVPYGADAIFIRGGDNSSKESAGVFAFSGADKDEIYGFRPSIIVLSDEDEDNIALLESEMSILEGQAATINVHFKTTESWKFGIDEATEISTARADGKKPMDIVVQYYNDSEIITKSVANQKLVSLQKADGTMLTGDDMKGNMTSGEYLAKIELGGYSDAEEKFPVFAYYEDKEGRIIINSMNLLTGSDEVFTISGIDLNKVKVITYGKEGTKLNIKSIEILNLPDKLEYAIGESLDVKGGKIRAHGSLGETVDIIMEAKHVISEFNSNSTGTKEVTIEYGGRKATFNVTVTNDFYTLTLTSSPIGAGILGRAGTYRAGAEVKLTAEAATKYKFVEWKETTGHGVVITGNTFTMPEANTTIEATFKEVTGIEVTKQPTKIVYNKNEYLDLTGGEVTIHYSNGTTEVKLLKEVTTNPYHGALLLTEGIQTIAASYEGVGPVTFNITVNGSYSLLLTRNIPDGGTVSGAGTKTAGGIFDISTTLSQDYIFSGWTCKDTATSQEMTIVTDIDQVLGPTYIRMENLGQTERTYKARITMPTCNITITANFIAPLWVTYIGGEGGGVQLEGTAEVSGRIEQKVAYGGDATAVTAIPSTGYRFVKWSDDTVEKPKKSATRHDEDITVDVTLTNEEKAALLTYTAEFEPIYWNVIYKNCAGTTMSSENNVKNEYPATNAPVGCNLPGHVFTSWSFRDESGETPDLTNITREGFVPDGTVKDYIVYAECSKNIAFNPDGSVTVSAAVETSIETLEIQAGTLQYIINENNTQVPTDRTSDYTTTADSFFEIMPAGTNAWYANNSTVNGYTGNMYRSAVISPSGASNATIVINTPRVIEKIRFKYTIDAAADSKIKITINGEEKAEISGNLSGWITYESNVRAIDGDIIIELTYEKGSSPSGLDLAAICDLKVLREWTTISDPNEVRELAVTTGNNYVYAKGNNLLGVEVIECSEAFNGIAVFGDVDLDGNMDLADYTMLDEYINEDGVLSTYSEEKSDIDLDGDVDVDDLDMLFMLINGSAGANQYLLTIYAGDWVERIVKPAGEEITVRAIAPEGQEFDSWTGDISATTAVMTFIMPSNNVTITANFVPEE